jgi:hypothetical protein
VVKLLRLHGHRYLEELSTERALMYTKSEILERMALYRVDGGGIGSWLTDRTCDTIFERLARIDDQPLPAVQLNQLLVLGHEVPVSDGFCPARQRR